MPLTPHTRPMHAACRLACEPSYCVGHTERGRNAETQGHMIGHRVALHPFDALLLIEFPDDPLACCGALPRDHTTSVLWDEHNVILAIPTDVRWALPVSHETLLPSERGGSLQGGVSTTGGRTTERQSLCESHRQRRWLTCWSYPQVCSTCPITLEL